MTAQRFDVYTQVTNNIIAAIEAGAGDWQMPWHRSGEGLNRPVNIDTAKAYRGINIVSLWAAGQARGFTTGTWGTYRQWQNKGCQVRKGEKSSLVVFYKELDVEEQNADTGETEHATRLMARASWVFNADQVDGYEAPALPERELRTPPERQQWVNSLLLASTVFATDSGVIVPFARGTYFDGGSSALAYLGPDRTWRSLSGAPPLVGADHKSFFGLLTPADTEVVIGVFERR